MTRVHLFAGLERFSGQRLRLFRFSQFRHRPRQAALDSQYQGIVRAENFRRAWANLQQQTFGLAGFASKEQGNTSGCTSSQLHLHPAEALIG